MKGFNLKLIVHILGLLLLFNSLFMGITTLSSYLMDDGATNGMLTAFLINLSVGGLAIGSTLNHRKEIKNRNFDKVFIFNDWTFASSPSIRPFDHPVYDIWLKKCYS